LSAPCVKRARPRPAAKPGPSAAAAASPEAPGTGSSRGLKPPASKNYSLSSRGPAARPLRGLLAGRETQACRVSISHVRAPKAADAERVATHGRTPARSSAAPATTPQRTTSTHCSPVMPDTVQAAADTREQNGGKRAGDVPGAVIVSCGWLAGSGKESNGSLPALRESAAERPDVGAESRQRQRVAWRTSGACRGSKRVDGVSRPKLGSGELDSSPWAEGQPLQAHRGAMKRVFFSRDDRGLPGATGAGAHAAAGATRDLRHQGATSELLAGNATAGGGGNHHLVTPGKSPLALQVQGTKSR
jgi:hypothetical protein